MALFDPNVNTSLSDVLGNRANLEAQQTQDAYAQKKKRLVAMEAHSGRLTSGVSDYPLADLATGNATDVADINSSLAGALGQIPAEGYLNDQELSRNYALAKLIGSLNKPDRLQSGLSGAASGAAAGSAAGPWGALAGGIGGGLYGAFG